MAGVFDKMKLRIGRLFDDYAHLRRGAALVFSSGHDTNRDIEWSKVLGPNPGRSIRPCCTASIAGRRHGIHHVSRCRSNLRMMLPRCGADQCIRHAIEEFFQSAGLLCGLHRFASRVAIGFGVRLRLAAGANQRSHLLRKAPPVFIECVGADGTTDKGCALNARSSENGVNIFSQSGHGDGTRCRRRIGRVHGDR